MAMAGTTSQPESVSTQSQNTTTSLPSSPLPSVNLTTSSEVEPAKTTRGDSDDVRLIVGSCVGAALGLALCIIVIVVALRKRGTCSRKKKKKVLQTLPSPYILTALDSYGENVPSFVAPGYFADKSERGETITNNYLHTQSESVSVKNDERESSNTDRPTSTDSATYEIGEDYVNCNQGCIKEDSVLLDLDSGNLSFTRGITKISSGPTPVEVDSLKSPKHMSGSETLPLPFDKLGRLQIRKTSSEYNPPRSGSNGSVSPYKGPIKWKETPIIIHKASTPLEEAEGTEEETGDSTYFSMDRNEPRCRISLTPPAPVEPMTLARKGSSANDPPPPPRCGSSDTQGYVNCGRNLSASGVHSDIYQNTTEEENHTDPDSPNEMYVMVDEPIFSPPAHATPSAIHPASISESLYEVPDHQINGFPIDHKGSVKYMNLLKSNEKSGPLSNHDADTNETSDTDKDPSSPSQDVYENIGASNLKSANTHTPLEYGSSLHTSSCDDAMEQASFPSRLNTGPVKPQQHNTPKHNQGLNKPSPKPHTDSAGVQNTSSSRNVKEVDDAVSIPNSTTLEAPRTNTKTNKKKTPMFPPGSDRSPKQANLSSSQRNPDGATSQLTSPLTDNNAVASSRLKAVGPEPETSDDGGRGQLGGSNPNTVKSTRSPSQGTARQISRTAGKSKQGKGGQIDLRELQNALKSKIKRTD